ncbi:hypothetical protein TURU_146649 [Turdus rufiventris]|nr:hypothetical protein TURU_146649 [Turdus rufiventris]
MQSPEAGSDSAAPVALHPSAPAQAPVVQAVPASQQRVLVQATGSAPKGAQMQQISVPRVQQVPQQVQSVQHVYPAQVQYVEGGEAVYTNGTIRAAYSYSSEAQIYAPAGTAPYFESQGGGGGGGAQVTTAASSPTAIPSHNMVGITMDIGGSQILSGSGAYLIHGGLENSRHSLSHTSRSSPATLMHSPCTPVLLNFVGFLTKYEEVTVTESLLPALLGEEEPEGTLPKDKLITLCKYEPILKWMRSCDHILYQALVEILIPDVLRPVPSTLTQAIRNFAKSLEGWLMNAMSDFPPQVVQTKEQASWVCQCEEGMVQKLEQDFKLTLQQQSSLDQWASWLDNVVTQVLKHHEGSPSFPKAARQFLLKWSFYSSMVIRDLTLRSAASFGSFHLIRLLYDEYMFYLVEHRVAQATGETPIAVMGEFGDLTSLSPTLLDKGTWALLGRAGLALGTCCAGMKLPVAPFPALTVSFADDISELSTEVDAERALGEPLVKRERCEPGHSLQDI